MAMDQIRVVGVLALQGAFIEHIKLLRQATIASPRLHSQQWSFIEVRTPTELESCCALVIPGGESTTMTLVAQRSGLLEPLREFTKIKRRPVWGTCAGLILLAESATRTKKGGQELIGGLDIRVNRNHFGRQTESFETELNLPFLGGTPLGGDAFRTIFIRAPIVERILPSMSGIQIEEAQLEDTIVAPALLARTKSGQVFDVGEVEVLARLPRNPAKLPDGLSDQEAGDIVAVRQANCFGTSFHPELSQDARIHIWWLHQVLDRIQN